MVLIYICTHNVYGIVYVHIYMHIIIKELQKHQ